MKRFEGKCPKCGNDDLEEINHMLDTEFVTVDLECRKCGASIDLIYDNALIMDFGSEKHE